MIQHAAALALLSFAFLPEARAYCYYDGYGYRRCSGMSSGARIGIGIAIAVVGLLLICFAAWLRRRRIQRANKAYIVQGGQQPHQPGFYQGNQGVSQPPYGGYQGQQGGYNQQTQYPAAVHTPTGQNFGAGAKQTYAPPAGAPPTEPGFGQPPSYPGKQNPV